MIFTWTVLQRNRNLAPNIWLCGKERSPRWAQSSWTERDHGTRQPDWQESSWEMKRSTRGGMEERATGNTQRGCYRGRFLYNHEKTALSILTGGLLKQSWVITPVQFGWVPAFIATKVGVEVPRRIRYSWERSSEQLPEKELEREGGLEHSSERHRHMASSADSTSPVGTSSNVVLWEEDHSPAKKWSGTLASQRYALDC